MKTIFKLKFWIAFPKNFPPVCVYSNNLKALAWNNPFRKPCRPTRPEKICSSIFPLIKFTFLKYYKPVCFPSKSEATILKLQKVNQAPCLLVCILFIGNLIDRNFQKATSNFLLRNKNLLFFQIKRLLLIDQCRQWQLSNFFPSVDYL